MFYRRFGRTGLQMPVLSFGCMRSMHSWIDAPLAAIPHASTNSLEELARTALSHGINHFETAHGYGSSERQLGAVLSGLPRSEILLQTKVAPDPDPEKFLRTFHESLARLQVDHVDLLALHGINDFTSLWHSCRRGGCLAAARRLQREGKARHIGFSGHGPLEVILAAIDHLEDGGFDYVNLHWYYILDVNRPAIRRAAERDLGVYIISPTDKGGMLHHPSGAMTKECAPLSPILFNDLYCLSEPGVTGIGVGAARTSDFNEHLRAVAMLSEQRPPFVTETIRKLERCMENHTGHMRPDALWFELPPWEAAPANINLRYISWLLHLARGWGMKEFAGSRYRMLAKGDTWVQGNNAAALDQVDFTEAMRRYPAISDAFMQDLRNAHSMFAGS